MAEKKFNPVWILIAIFAIIMVIEIWIYVVDYELYAPYVELGDTTEYDEFFYTDFANKTYFITIIFPAITVVCFILWLKYFGVKSTAGKVGLLFTIGVGLWFGGDLYYTLLWFLAGIDSPPEDNPARYMYVMGYVIFIIALVIQIRSGPTKLSLKEYVVLVCILGNLLYWMIQLVVIPLALYEGTTEYPVELMTRLFLTIFSAGDLTVISLIIVLIFKYRGGMYARSWFLLVSGFAVFAVYDLLNVSLGYYSVSPVSDFYSYYTDQIYALAYIMLGIGAMHFFNTIRTTSV